MVVTRVFRVSHALATAAVVTVSLPLCLTACSSPEDLGTRAAELRAANESDLLSVPVEHVYEVSGLEIISPQALASLSDATQSTVEHSGYAVLSDDIITAAEFTFGVAGVRQASFTLTEPTVIRRAEGETEPVYATGELEIDGHDPIAATVKLTPSVIDDESLEFAIDFVLPGDVAADSLLEHEISARITLTATS